MSLIRLREPRLGLEGLLPYGRFMTTREYYFVGKHSAKEVQIIQNYYPQYRWNKTLMRTKVLLFVSIVLMAGFIYRISSSLASAEYFDSFIWTIGAVATVGVVILHCKSEKYQRKVFAEKIGIILESYDADRNLLEAQNYSCSTSAFAEIEQRLSSVAPPVPLRKILRGEEGEYIKDVCEDILNNNLPRLVEIGKQIDVFMTAYFTPYIEDWTVLNDEYEALMNETVSALRHVSP